MNLVLQSTKKAKKLNKHFILKEIKSYQQPIKQMFHQGV